MGKTRVIAETGAGQHGVATATAAALLGLECVVYMGEVDTERQALNVARMQLLGAEVVPVDHRQRARSRTRSTRRCATGSTNVDDTHYLLGTVAGPHPFPAMVRDFHARHRRRGPRARCSSRPAGCPTPSCACVGGGSNAIGIFHALPRRRRRAAARLRGRRRRRRHRPARGHDHRRRRPACCTAPAPTCCRTRTARPSSRTRSRPAWTTPASAPSTPTCTTPAGPSYAPVTDAEAMEAFALLCRTEGIIPAIESRARARRRAARSASELGPGRRSILVNLSGRGDKDVDTAAEWFGLLRQDSPSRDRPRGRAAVSTADGPAGAARSPAVGRGVDAPAPRAAPPWSATCPPASPTSTATIAAVHGDGRGRRRRRRGRPAVLRPGDGRPGHPGAPPRPRSRGGVRVRRRASHVVARRRRRPARRRWS